MRVPKGYEIDPNNKNVIVPTEETIAKECNKIKDHLTDGQRVSRQHYKLWRNKKGVITPRFGPKEDDGYEFPEARIM